jgi:ASC-1-like (ASCH) protein
MPAVEIGIREDLITDILCGRKTIEGRLRRGKFALLRVGDILTICMDSPTSVGISRCRTSARLRVNSLQAYPTFASLLQYEGVQLLLPGATFEEAVDLYHSFYTPDEEHRHGVLAIRFTLEVSS